MPLGKYYCDYCDKQFQDTAAARRRHLSGVQHQRNRALWYDSLKDAHGVFLFQQDGNLDMGVCHHFVRKGSCKYGDTCKYYHPTQNMAQRTPPVIGYPPNSFDNRLVGGSTLPGNVAGDRFGISRGNLPPSLRPPPDGGYPSLPFVDWG
ncbi:Zinc finger CCCH domain-containing protein 3 [Apostasia shenzhenica]|uniref:Zinc finger CCCH domain-containing protein 3 n=1 Tax=Apostasia shenzhenica TaxID=1088818 RepID=A0A2I0BHE3_9ASPA|nr:Zinc finger CCCH domain-containing protein 3 [Apostasia shenzhenica]